MENKKAFAEVIDSSLDLFIAQSWEWDVFPEFGSLVQVRDKTRSVLGCVTEVKTGSMDPVRYPFPHKKTEEELRAEQPQIFEFLKTTFVVTAVGYLAPRGDVVYELPPVPAKIHAFVSRASWELEQKVFGEPDFLYLLFSSHSKIQHFDDLLLAIFRRLSTRGALKQDLLDGCCQRLSLLTGNDYRRMKLFLKRMQGCGA